ncbi:hypothetical protein D3C72_2323360 [compost metagenome]
MQGPGCDFSGGVYLSQRLIQRLGIGQVGGKAIALEGTGVDTQGLADGNLATDVVAVGLA